MKLWRYLVPALLLVVAAAVVLWITRPQEVVEEPFTPRQSHRDYREALDRLEIADTAMARAWVDAAEEALEEPVGVTPPVSETLYFDPREPGAVGYWFPVTRGRRIVIDLEAEHDYYFADVFRLRSVEGAGEEGESQLEPEELVASRPENQDRVVFEARSNGFYLLRLQPELLRGGEFGISMVEEASLAFPVEGATERDIWSFFGDGRDGGAREHHGVDVFAPRGTPVLAVGDAEVLRVGTRDRGGKIVTLWDEARGIMLYYAHLEDQLTTRGTRVEAGDVIGTVGNSGNAITTPPHLHIGIYQGSWRRPVDPWGYFVNPPRTRPDPVPATGRQGIGEWITAPEPISLVSRLSPEAPTSPEPRNRNPYLQGAGDSFEGAESRPDPELRPPAERRISVEAGAPLRVTGASAGFLRVRTLEGESGFLALPSSGLDLNRLGGDPPDDPGAAVTPGDGRLLRDHVSGDAFGRLPAGESVIALAATPRGELVRLASGRVALLEAARQE